MINRRQFSTAAAATAFVPQSVWGQSRAHPFEKLIDVKAERRFSPEPDTYTLALFMTAEQLYPSCGEAFLCVHYVKQQLPNPDKIQPVVVMPKTTDQTNPQDRRNFNRAWNSDLGFKVLTGELHDVQNAAQQYGAFFKTRQGKVIEHSLDIVFMTPSGEKLFQADTGNFYLVEKTINELLNACNSPAKRSLCL